MRISFQCLEEEPYIQHLENTSQAHKSEDTRRMNLIDYKMTLAAN
jgi:hypothetical protein